MHTFLATIGRSSKRDEVAGVEVGPARVPRPVRHRPARLLRGRRRDPRREPLRRGPVGAAGRVAGHRPTARTPCARCPATRRPEPGTTVTLTARPGRGALVRRRPGDASWPGRSARCCRYDITVDAGTASATRSPTPRRCGPRRYRTPGRPPRSALAAYGREALGFTAARRHRPRPAGRRACAGSRTCCPSAASPPDRGGHRVHLKGMLLSDSAERAAAGLGVLRPLRRRHRHAAAHRVPRGAVRRRDARRGPRRARRPDPRLARRAGGQPSRTGWPGSSPCTSSASRRSPCHDDELLRIMLPWLPFETTDGAISLAEFARPHRWCTSPAPSRSSARSPRSRRRRASAWSTAATPTTPTWSSGCRRSCPAPSVVALAADAVRRPPRPGGHRRGTAAGRVPRRGPRPARRPRLRRGAARLPPGVGARALPRQPRRPARARAGAGRGRGRPAVVGDPRRPAVDGAARAARAQPPQPAGPADRRPPGPGAGRHRRRSALRPGPADDPPAAAARPRRRCSTGPSATC